MKLHNLIVPTLKTFLYSKNDDGSTIVELDLSNDNLISAIQKAIRTQDLMNESGSQPIFIIQAPTWEEANIICNFRIWGPDERYEPIGNPITCPQCKINNIYPKGSGQCICGFDNG